MMKTVDLITTKGHKITAFADDFIARSIQRHGLYEKETCDFLSCLLGKLNKPNVLDIGANIGNQRLVFSMNAERVFSFEPLPEVFQLL
ncbi:MAG: hypothetical protein OXE99_15390, partial [Cellvibrionales bacterium]|nr:hypothetical protein [Cellvibrionales bacterium]